MLRRMVREAMQTPDGGTRTFRAGAAVVVVAHRGTRWGVRVTYTLPTGVTTARLVSDERVIRAALKRAGTLIGDETDIVGAARETLVLRMMRDAAARSAAKQPGPVSDEAYRALIRRKGRPSGPGGRRHTLGVTTGTPRRISYGLPGFHLYRR